MNIDCPKCEKDNELDHDDLPESACYYSDYECKYCGHAFSIGWSDKAELR